MSTDTAMSSTESAAHQESLRIARAETAAGDHAAADRRIRAVLDATRTGRPPVWFLAVANLIALYMRQAREIESLRLARVLADGYAHRLPMHRAYALQTLCMAFANIDDHDRLERELPRFETSIQALDSAEVPVYARSVALLRALVALRRNELDDARRRCEWVIASFDDTATSVTRGPAHLIAAQVAHRAGRFAEGAVSARLSRQNAPSVSASLPALLVETQCVFETDGPAAACDVARRALADIEASASAQREPCHVVESGSQLAEFVAQRCDDDALARRLLDAAVASVIRRADELGRSLDDLPELAATSPDDERSLASFRVRFRLGRQQLLTAVARALPRATERGAFLRGDENGLVCVCAWCLRVRDRSGGWIPTGHMVEAVFDAVVTHGICADCTPHL